MVVVKDRKQKKFKEYVYDNKQEIYTKADTKPTSTFQTNYKISNN